MGVTMTGEILFELPVYRVSKEVYYNDFTNFYNKRKIPDANSIKEEQLNATLLETYGGDWEYNDIVGYLQFYVCMNDIRCAYYKGYQKKAFRNGKRYFYKDNDTIYKINIKKSYENKT